MCSESRHAPCVKCQKHLWDPPFYVAVARWQGSPVRPSFTVKAGWRRPRFQPDILRVVFIWSRLLCSTHAKNGTCRAVPKKTAHHDLSALGRQLGDNFGIQEWKIFDLFPTWSATLSEQLYREKANRVRCNVNSLLQSPLHNIPNKCSVPRIQKHMFNFLGRLTEVTNSSRSKTETFPYFSSRALRVVYPDIV